MTLIPTTGPDAPVQAPSRPLVPSTAYVEPRPVAQALLRGARCACPACGTGRMYRKYLKVADHCPDCGEALHHQRADDAPPYATIFVVGHIVVPLMVMVEEMFRPPVWAHLVLWLPLTVILSLILLPPLKSMLVNLQWALRMHGFDPADPERDAHPPAA